MLFFYSQIKRLDIPSAIYFIDLLYCIILFFALLAIYKIFFAPPFTPSKPLLDLVTDALHVDLLLIYALLQSIILQRIFLNTDICRF